MLSKTKKVLVLMALISQGLWMSGGLAQEVKVEKRQFLVTAYYSPQPDQSFYIRGSYEADKALNGEGTHGADGTEVYVGMLAAPAKYPFGTKIKIPGLGVGEVHDRGGAIGESDDYDRIDVWMGAGEDGLSRALNWGARFVEGEIYWDTTQATVNLDYSWVNPNLSDASVTELQLKSQPTEPEEVEQEVEEVQLDTFSPELPKKSSLEESQFIGPRINPEVVYIEAKREVLVAGVGKGATGESVKELQRMLAEVGYYEGEVSGSYDQSTTESVYRFQKDHGVVTTPSDVGAGHFGPKTHQTLLDALDHKTEVLKDYPKEVQVWVPSSNDLPTLANLTLQDSAARKKLAFADTSSKSGRLIVKASTDELMELELNDQGEQVVQLQEELIERGYLASGLSTGYFGPKTSEAVLRFQLENGIVQSASDAGAGRVGPKTLEVLYLS